MQIGGVTGHGQGFNSEPSNQTVFTGGEVTFLCDKPSSETRSWRICPGSCDYFQDPESYPDYEDYFVDTGFCLRNVQKSSDSTTFQCNYGFDSNMPICPSSNGTLHVIPGTY